MTAIADRYRRLSTRFADLVHDVPADRWAAPSPCDGWTARDVVSHVIDVHGMMLKPLQRGLSDAPSVDDDPEAAIGSAIADLQAVLDDAELASSEYDGYFGRTCVQDTIDRFMCLDLVVHGWDLARATGQEFRADEASLRSSEAMLAPGDDDRSGPDAIFGPPVPVPADAPLADRVIALSGRRPDWQPGD